jgi:hypothetical protein
MFERKLQISTNFEIIIGDFNLKIIPNEVKSQVKF